MQTAVQVGMTEELRAAIDELRDTRRERIAVAVLSGIADQESRGMSWGHLARVSVIAADALIAELTAPTVRKKSVSAKRGQRSKADRR